jgi:hypothetical protein
MNRNVKHHCAYKSAAKVLATTVSAWALAEAVVKTNHHSKAGLPTSPTEQSEVDTELLAYSPAP